MVQYTISILQFSSIISTINDMSFVIKIIALVYLIYVLYITFSENQVIFLGASLIGAYLILFHSPIILTLVVIAFISINPYFFQNIAFGLSSVNDVRGMMGQEHIQNRIANVEMSLQKGEPVDPGEMEFYQQYAQNQQGQMQDGQSDINSHMIRMLEARRR